MTTTTTEAFETGLRAEFEALARGSEMSVKRNAAGNGYAHLMAQVAWDFYRAATERAAKPCDEQIAHIRSVRNDSAEDMRREIAMLREFHSFFKDRCEFLYAHFGFAPIDLYNKCALNAAAIRASSGKGDCDV